MTCHPTKTSQIPDPSNPLSDGVALDFPSSFQGAKTYTTHNPSVLVKPCDQPAQPLQHHHVLFLSILAPSSTNIVKFHKYFPLKIIFAAMYMKFFETVTYARGYHGIFHVYPTLYVEKDPISVWDETHYLGCP